MENQATKCWYKRNPDVKTKILPDGHIVLFSANSDRGFTLSPMAAIAWEFFDGAHSIEEIANKCSAIAEPADSTSLSEDICILVNGLTDAGLLLEVDPGAKEN